MALILLGGNLADIRGSVGGVTYARNRYGLFQRNRTKPVDPASASQEAFRTRFAAAIPNWHALTAAQRDLWNAKALNTDFVNALGQSFHPSGFNLFARADLLLDMAGLSGVTSPPLTPTIDDAGSSLTYTADPGLEHNSTTANWPAAAVMLLWHQRSLSSGIYFYKGPYTRFSHKVAGDYTADKFLLTAAANLDADSAQFAAWRLVGTDGAASAMRRGRAFKPPA